MVADDGQASAVVNRIAITDLGAFESDWRAGVLTIREMAAVRGCSMGCVSMTARRLGLPKRKPGPHAPRHPEPIGLTGGRWVPGQRGVLHWQEAS